VNLAIGMTEACVRLCADSVREQYPKIEQEELLNRIRERIMFVRQCRREGLETGDF